MLENNTVKRHAFCMRKRVKYVTVHAQKFSDITICILVLHLSELFTYPNFFFWQLVQWVSDNRGCTVFQKRDMEDPGNLTQCCRKSVLQ